MGGHRRTATTAAYTHPNYAVGVAIQHARFGVRHTKRHTDSENANGGETETAPSACDHLVGTGRIELPTPTVSRMRPLADGSLSLIENGGHRAKRRPIWAPRSTISRHGVYIAELAEYLLEHPGDADAVVALATLGARRRRGGRLVKPGRLTLLR